MRGWVDGKRTGANVIIRAPVGWHAFISSSARMAHQCSCSAKEICYGTQNANKEGSLSPRTKVDSLPSKPASKKADWHKSAIRLDKPIRQTSGRYRVVTPEEALPGIRQEAACRPPRGSGTQACGGRQTSLRRLARAALARQAPRLRLLAKGLPTRRQRLAHAALGRLAPRLRRANRLAQRLTVPVATRAVSIASRGVATTKIFSRLARVPFAPFPVTPFTVNLVRMPLGNSAGLCQNCGPRFVASSWVRPGEVSRKRHAPRARRARRTPPPHASWPGRTKRGEGEGKLPQKRCSLAGV